MGGLSGRGILDMLQPQQPDPAMAGILGLLGQQNLSAPMLMQALRMMQAQQQPVQPGQRVPASTTGIRG